LADGVERGILTVNRMLPGPSIQVSPAGVVVTGKTCIIEILNFEISCKFKIPDLKLYKKYVDIQTRQT
jgi:hypothetical protein